jgi:hypothetical protein
LDLVAIAIFGHRRATYVYRLKSRDLAAGPVPTDTSF